MTHSEREVLTVLAAHGIADCARQTDDGANPPTVNGATVARLVAKGYAQRKRSRAPYNGRTRGATITRALLTDAGWSLVRRAGIIEQGELF